MDGQMLRHWQQERNTCCHPSMRQALLLLLLLWDVEDKIKPITGRDAYYHESAKPI